MVQQRLGQRHHRRLRIGQPEPGANRGADGHDGQHDWVGNRKLGATDRMARVGLIDWGLTAPPDGVRIQAGDHFGQAALEGLQVCGG